MFVVSRLWHTFKNVADFVQGNTACSSPQCFLRLHPKCPKAKTDSSFSLSVFAVSLVFSTADGRSKAVPRLSKYNQGAIVQDSIFLGYEWEENQIVLTLRCHFVDWRCKRLMHLQQLQLKESRRQAFETGS